MSSSNTHKQALPIYSNVPGAPFRIGARVLVAGATDDTCAVDYVGKIGTVSFMEFSCGCGQSYPHDPMICVCFCDGTKEEFWQEEIVSL